MTHAGVFAFPFQQARALIDSNVFQAAIVLCIMFNTFLLCLDSYPEEPGLVHVTEVNIFDLRSDIGAFKWS